MKMKKEKCSICGCEVHRNGDYAKPTIKGRSHATKHHFVAERFYGRSINKCSGKRKPIFDKCPWDIEGKTAVFCYECHEELIHNPVFLPEDIEKFSKLVKAYGFSEDKKRENKKKIGKRIELLHEVLSTGLKQLAKKKQ